MKPEIKDPCVNAKRQCILNAAQKLFLQEGFRKVSIDKIVATAGVSKPTVYAHFANKSELFRAVIEERTQAMLDAARQHMTLTDSPRDFLQNYGEVFLSMIDAPDTVCMYRHVAAEVNDFPEIAKHFYVRSKVRFIWSVSSVSVKSVPQSRFAAAWKRWSICF
jgi:TetR/AcrR family transcriptional repressor of mexJK operon